MRNWKLTAVLVAIQELSYAFNALAGTALAPRRSCERWLEQAQSLIDRISTTQAAQRLDVARSTGFRWWHRFLALPNQFMAWTNSTPGWPSAAARCGANCATQSARTSAWPRCWSSSARI